MPVTSRQELEDYCLRALGEPMLQINVTPEQIEDRVDYAIQVYQEFHQDATRRNYYEYQVTAADVTNGYFTLPSNILYVVRMFPVSSSFIAQSGMFSVQYQFALHNYHNLASFGGGLDYYEQMQQYLALVDMKLNGQPQVTFARRQNRFYLWGEFETQDVKAGDYIALEVYEVVDPETFTSIYDDMFLKDFTTASIKYQWGQNMSKYEGIQLPGGVTVSGQQMKEEAKSEMEDLRERLRSEQEKPIDFLVG